MSGLYGGGPSKVQQRAAHTSYSGTLIRIGSYEAKHLVLEYSDGMRILCYNLGHLPMAMVVARRIINPDINHLYLCPGPIDQAVPTTCLDECRHLVEINRGEWGPTYKFHGLRLRPCRLEEKQFFDRLSRQLWAAKWKKLADSRTAVVVAIKSKQWQQMPGGKFLIVSIPHNKERNRTWWDYKTGQPYQWDVADPKTKVMALVGIGAQYGWQVFRIGSKLYVRAYRHKVLGRPRSSFSSYYQSHSSPWGFAGRMALTPFKGKFFPYKSPV